MESIFNNDINKRKTNLTELNKTAGIITVFKIIFFALICYGCYKLYINGYPTSLILLLILEIIAFIIACIFHKSTYDKIRKEEGMIKIDEDNIKRIKGEWSNFKDIGEEFLDYDHDYGSDLDIVGHSSIFQMINSTGTYYGRNRFAKDLLSPEFAEQDLNMRHDAIKELKNKYDWCTEAEYYFSLVGVDSKFPELISDLQNKERFIKSTPLKLLFKLTSILTCVAVVFAILSRSTLGFIILNCCIIVQLLLWLLGYLKSNNYVFVMRKLAPKIEHYASIIGHITSEDFSCDKLKEMESSLNTAKVGLKDLSRIASNINQRNNALVCILLNALLLWDYKNAIDLDNWKQKYADSVENWFETLGELESLISFANLPRVCNNTCIPTLTKEEGFMVATNLGHPLINNEKRICNDFNLNKDICIISGSNMSGKTTFMRTVGINMVLACSGSYVCADNLSFSKMKIVTSMRIRDDLNEGISTFYAELKRIKKIIDCANNNPDTLFLIDEIFRGTNSVDRLKGCEGVLRELSRLGVTGMITTHDLEICNLEKERSNVINYSFNEHYVDGEIYFDYLLKKGPSKTTNAEYLLRKIGIL